MNSTNCCRYEDTQAFSDARNQQLDCICDELPHIIRRGKPIGPRGSRANFQVCNSDLQGMRVCACGHSDFMAIGVIGLGLGRIGLTGLNGNRGDRFGSRARRTYRVYGGQCL